MTSHWYLHIFVAAAAVLAVGCATNQADIDPELAPSKQTADEYYESLNSAEETIRSELETLRQLSGDIEGLTEELTDAQLPFSLLRLVAMNCINTEYNASSSQVVDLGGRPLSCRPAHIQRLTDALQDHPASVRDRVWDLLYTVDQARMLRGGLRQRLTVLPDTLEDYREHIVDERATLRQLEADLEQERNVYGSGQWRQVNQKLDEYRQLLEDLERRVDELAEDYPRWPDVVDAHIAEIYFELSDLRGGR